MCFPTFRIDDLPFAALTCTLQGRFESAVSEGIGDRRPQRQPERRNRAVAMPKAVRPPRTDLEANTPILPCPGLDATHGSHRTQPGSDLAALQSFTRRRWAVKSLRPLPVVRTASIIGVPDAWKRINPQTRLARSDSRHRAPMPARYLAAPGQRIAGHTVYSSSWQCHARYTPIQQDYVVIGGLLTHT